MKAFGFDRRSFLARGCQLGALGLIASRAPSLFAATSTRRRIGATDWTLGKRGDVSVFDLAKSIGLDGVQVSVNTTKDHRYLFDAKKQQEYRDAAAKSGVKISSLGIGELNRVPLKNDPRAAQWVFDSVDVATALAAPVVLVPSFFAAEFALDQPEDVKTVVAALKKAAAKAEAAGVTLGLENYLTAADNLKLIEMVGSPALKVYYDVGNATDKGHDIYEEIALLGDRICEVHAKDGKSMLGEGRIDFHKVRAALDAIHYPGWIVIEVPLGNAATDEVAQAYRKNVQYLREVFAA